MLVSVFGVLLILGGGGWFLFTDGGTSSMASCQTGPIESIGAVSLSLIPIAFGIMLIWG